jgi:hypothetical protein
MVGLLLNARYRAAARARAVLAVVGAAVVIGGMVGGPVPPAAPALPPSVAATWNVVPSPSPGTPEGLLNDVSCPTVNWCAAVGSGVGPTGAVGTLAEVWNGTTWNIEPTSDPASSTWSTLSSVSCAAVGACVAVGSYASGTPSEGLTNTAPMSEALEDGTWTMLGTPDPLSPTGVVDSTLGESEAQLAGVSCPAVNACTAVGSFGPLGTSTALVEVWDGLTWVVSPLSLVAQFVSTQGGVSSEFGAVSCISSTRCEAVGSYYDPVDSTTAALAAESVDGVLVPQDAAGNPDYSYNNLESVSCVSTTSCFAVGEAAAYGSVPLAEQLSGQSWSLLSSPAPTGYGALISVSCTAYSSCEALGTGLTDAIGGNAEDTVGWNGSAWSLQVAPALPAGLLFAGMAALSCPSTTACTAVGSTSYPTAGLNVPGQNFVPNQALADQWNGSAWTTESAATPDGGQVTSLDGVSCASSTSCVAVGSQLGGLSPLVAEAWNGSAWSLQTFVTPPDYYTLEYGNPFTVSCAAADFCMAVGTMRTGGPSSLTSAALAETWNGSVWALTTPVDPDGDTNYGLNGVSCSSATSCMAVGYAQGSNQMMAETWNGSAWSMAPSPVAPAGAIDPNLGAVSCFSAGDCVAVGSYYDGAISTSAVDGLAEGWNGSEWTIESVPTPAEESDVNLTGVSCPTASWCMAVGSAATELGNFSTLTEKWNGSAWSNVLSPDTVSTSIQGGEEGQLFGVSCVSTTACSAVGTQVQGWDGLIWELQSNSVTPPTLSAVSCASASWCTATGRDPDKIETGST